MTRRFDKFPHNDDFQRALKDKMSTLKVLPGRLPQQFAELLKDALGSSTDTLDRLNRWLRENPSSFQTGDLESVVSKIAKETGLSRRELAPLVSVIVNIGFFAESDEKFNDLLEDLRSIGFVESQLEAFGRLMAGVRFPKGEGTIAVSQSLATGVAQLSDVNVLCDLRAVFEATPDDEDNQEKITKLIALVPCVLLSLDVRQESGRTETVVVQFSDHAFAKFRQTLSNASRQLDALREMAAASPEELSRRRSPQ